MICSKGGIKLSEWKRQYGNALTDGIAPFGGVEIEVRFPCRKCREMTHSDWDVEIESPDYTTERMSGSDVWSDNVNGTCKNCKEEHEIGTSNGQGGMLIQIDGVADTDVEFKITKDYEEPEEEMWQW